MRINTSGSTETQDGLYVDILSNIERIGDHCNNIAINIIQDTYYNEEMDYEDNEERNFEDDDFAAKVDV